MKKITIQILLSVVVFLNLSQTSYAGKVDVLTALKKGGYVIYMRHPHTDKSTKDTDKKNLENCATQRNLSEKGRQVARDIGAAIKKLNVSFKQIETSEFCRARQVPELMGMKVFKKTADLNHAGSLSKEDAMKRAAILISKFETMPADKTNTLLIGHSPNIKDVSLDLISKGFKPADMLVMKPTDKGYKFYARVTPDQWKEWAK